MIIKQPVVKTWYILNEKDVLDLNVGQELSCPDTSVIEEFTDRNLYLTRCDELGIVVESAQDTDAQKLLLELEVKSNKDYLDITDFKMTVDYYAAMTVAEQDSLTALRADAREFVRSNEVV